MTHSRFSARLRASLGALALAALAACTAVGENPDEPAGYDPIEGVNRYVFELNFAGDEFILKPIAVIYRGTVPEPARQGVRNWLGNLRLPWTAINAALQGNWPRAGDAVVRFSVNSVVGFFGVFDPAKDMGYLQTEEDFGQTMGVAGIGDAPYLMLPLIGPSNLRDTAGLVVDQLLDPVNLVARPGVNFKGNWFTYTRGGLSAIDQREANLEAIAELQRGSVDYYAAVRSAYRQLRRGAIQNGPADKIQDVPGLFR